MVGRLPYNLIAQCSQFSRRTPFPETHMYTHIPIAFFSLGLLGKEVRRPSTFFCISLLASCLLFFFLFSSSSSSLILSSPLHSPHTPPKMSLPDYMTDRNAVLNDQGVNWRGGKAPNYNKPNALFEAERTQVHPSDSLEFLVENLVKNWEKEASFKTEAVDWRTIDHKVYKFSTNGGSWQSVEDMLRVGTYNALIGESQYYSSKNSGFEESHLTFKQSLRGGFAWECLKVYSGPPVVAFKWRHWGKFTGKLRCPVSDTEKLVADPSNENVEIFGVTIAHVNDKFQIESLETFYDPAALFNEMLKNSPSVLKCPITGQSTGHDDEKETEEETA